MASTTRDPELGDPPPLNTDVGPVVDPRHNNPSCPGPKDPGLGTQTQGFPSARPEGNFVPNLTRSDTKKKPDSDSENPEEVNVKVTTRRKWNVTRNVIRNVIVTTRRKVNVTKNVIRK